MIKFLKKIFKRISQKIDSRYEEKEKIREKERKLLKIRMAAYNLGTKNALKPKEVFWHITFPKILKFSKLGTKYSIIGIITIGGIIGGTLLLLGSSIYAIFLYVALPIIIISMIFWILYFLEFLTDEFVREKFNILSTLLLAIYTTISSF